MVSSQGSSSTGSGPARKSAVRKGSQLGQPARKSMGVQFADFRSDSETSSCRGSVSRSVSPSSSTEVQRKSKVQFSSIPMAPVSVPTPSRTSDAKPRITLTELIAHRRSVASVSSRSSQQSVAPPSKSKRSLRLSLTSQSVQRSLERAESGLSKAPASLAAMSQCSGSPKSSFIDEHIEDDRRSVITSLTSISAAHTSSTRTVSSAEAALNRSRRPAGNRSGSRFEVPNGRKSGQAARAAERATPMDFFNAAIMDSPNQAHEIQRLFRQGDAVTGHQHGRKALMAALATGNEEEVEEEVRFETPEKLATELAKRTEKKRCSALVHEGSFDLLDVLTIDLASTKSAASSEASGTSGSSPMSTSSLRMRNAPWASNELRAQLLSAKKSVVLKDDRAEKAEREEEKKEAKKSLSARTLKSVGGLDSFKLPPPAKKSLPATLPSAETGLGPRGRKSQARFCCRFMVPKEIAEATDFRAPSYLIGPRGQNMKRIFEETNSKLRVRGQNSGHKEGPEQMEAQEPLQVCVSSDTREQNERTKAMVMTLFDKMIFDYAKSRNRRRSEFKVDVINGH